jgi:predicted transcriptional regulator
MTMEDVSKNELTIIEFFSKFLEISENLSMSELRLLYYFLTDANAKILPQSVLADKFKTNRVCINRSIARLYRLGYINKATINTLNAPKSIGRHTYSENSHIDIEEKISNINVSSNKKRNMKKKDNH